MDSAVRTESGNPIQFFIAICHIKMTGVLAGRPDFNNFRKTKRIELRDVRASGD